MSRDAIPRLAEFLATGVRPSDEAISWVGEGLRRWLFQDEGLPLPRVLGLPGTSHRCRIALRDCALRSAAARLEGSPWQRACELHARAVAFERGPWKRLRVGLSPPRELDELHQDLWVACMAWPLPARVQSFLDIVT